MDHSLIVGNGLKMLSLILEIPDILTHSPLLEMKDSILFIFCICSLWSNIISVNTPNAIVSVILSMTTLKFRI